MSNTKEKSALKQNTNAGNKNYHDDSRNFIAFENAKRLDLSFSDISYSIKPSYFSSERKKLLTNVSGNFRAGELTAIMGPSGAGKTMLMDVLAGFVTTSVSGDVKINGLPRDQKTFRRSSAYIMQYHVLHELLTVQESMHVAAELKLCATSIEKRNRINVLLKDLGLYEARATFAGSLSSGQKKRLAIAMELISDLPVMFFDEPTSGLDSVTTKQCVELLKSLAQAGRTIICTIHQPSASLFDLLDNLYVLAKGRCVYTGSPSNVVVFLESMGLRCPEYHNPADFLLEVASGEHGDHISRLSEAIKNGSSCTYQHNHAGDDGYTIITDQIYDSSIIKQKYYNSDALKSKCDYCGMIKKRNSNSYASSSLAQIRVLLWRYILITFRDRAYIMEILIAHLVMAIVTGLTFQKVGQDGFRSYENVKQLAFNLIFISFCAINAALITFPAELPIMTREYFNRWYKLRSVYIANKLMGLFIVAFAVTMYTLITYYLSDQIPEYWRFALLLLNSIAIALVNQVIGLFISVILNVKNVVFFGPYSVMPFVLFSGIFVRHQDVHPNLAWIYDISIFKYAYDGFMTSTFGFDRPRLTCNAEYCHYALPRAVLSAVGIKGNYWPSTLVLYGVYIVMHVLTYFCLRYKLKKYKYRL